MRFNSFARVMPKKNAAKCDQCSVSVQYRDKINPTLSFLYTPHSITVLVGIIACFVYSAFFETTVFHTASNVKRGLLAAAVVFLFIGMTQFPNGPFIRPHPAIWRLVLAASVIYLMMLIFTFFQHVDDARSFLGFMDPSLGVILEEKTYAANCDLNWDNLYNQMDAFVLAHSLGWYVKALLLRDYWLLWILSILFELSEYSLEHQLPNFAECWWDHWILDVLVCNWLGIYLGMKTCEYFEMKPYLWRGVGKIAGVKGKIQRTAAQFTPHSWTSFHWWGAGNTFKHYIGVLAILSLFNLCELNAFYLKYLLWIPPTHLYNQIRLAMHALIGAVAIREVYQYFSDKQCKRLGAQAWIQAAILSIETLICIKFGRNEFPNSAPEYVVRFWQIAVILLILYPFWQYFLKPRLFKDLKTE